MAGAVTVVSWVEAAVDGVRWGEGRLVRPSLVGVVSAKLAETFAGLVEVGQSPNFSDHLCLDVAAAVSTSAAAVSHGLYCLYYER